LLSDSVVNASRQILLKEEYETFIGHLQEWMSDKPGKYVLIKGQDPIGFFDTFLDAVRAGEQRFSRQAFFVEQIGVPVVDHVYTVRFID